MGLQLHGRIGSSLPRVRRSDVRPFSMTKGRCRQWPCERINVSSDSGAATSRRSSTPGRRIVTLASASRPCSMCGAGLGGDRSRFRTTQPRELHSSSSRLGSRTTAGSACGGQTEAIGTSFGFDRGRPQLARSRRCSYAPKARSGLAQRARRGVFLPEVGGLPERRFVRRGAGEGPGSSACSRDPSEEAVPFRMSLGTAPALPEVCALTQLRGTRLRRPATALGTGH
jgi:hypothetical protein